VIAGATSTTYTLVVADQGHVISFEVTPRTTVAPTTGSVAVSVATSAIVAASTAPSASGVSISGTAQVGQSLTGSYTYADVNNDVESGSTFRWLRDGVVIAGATSTTYTLVVADQGHVISFEVTPRTTVAPTTGSVAVSVATSAIVAAPNNPPTMSLVMSGGQFIDDGNNTGRSATDTNITFDLSGSSDLDVGGSVANYKISSNIAGVIHDGSASSYTIPGSLGRRPYLSSETFTITITDNLGATRQRNYTISYEL
ncbi:hypothetical protein KA057_02620, partial [Candidatus Gracilibacteria bacterium]|nr:hypothetical protein [Candidatus Gracilibacteria bacterium]